MTQQHKNGDTSPDRVANGDIVERLRTWFRDVNAVSAIDLMDEAANEIERLRQFDRLQPIKPAEDTHATHATPCEGSLQGEGTEPVAWAILHKDHQYVSLLREHAEAHNVYVDAEVVPLFRSPTLTDEIERLRNGAVEGCETVCPHVRGTVTQHCSLNFTLTDEEREAVYRAEARLRTAYVPDDQTAATLRSLLERLRSTPQTHPTLS
jgi:hypothetical protein